MSFNDLKIAELRGIAEGFGIEIPQGTKKSEIILMMEEEGISYEMYKKFSEANEEEHEETAPKAKPKKNINLQEKEEVILVKMDRHNFSYQTMGITFTQENPFMALPVSIAQEIFDTQDGFRPATPKEVQDFYS